MAKTLYTLSAVAEETGISMNTLLRYKKQYQRRIPSVGKGRTQRYQKEAFAVFAQIKKENLAKRGKKAGTRTKSAKKSVPAMRVVKKRSGAKKSASVAGDSDELLTLKEIAGLTQISYGTVARYAKLHAARIPSKGRGRKRRYPKEAVSVFNEIRGESKPGRKPAAKKRAVKKRSAPKRVARREADVSNAALSKKMAQVERALVGISKQLRQLQREAKKPIKVTIGG